ncbi:MAG TPA: (2Fe-2S) ferredoxin domain-containing protein [Tepidisphaeraceae bacterium]|nr:(2Fe-2S) ferredoxin domain-containing protein [Tepidisphaeraceae bacterium]
MAKLTSLQELTRVREQVRRDMKVRQETGTVIYIGMGTCGIAAGAKETKDAIEQELSKRQIDACVASVGCIGMCVKEPLVDIQQAGKSHVLYGNIKPEMVPRLIQEHLIQGEPVNEWVICRMPSE